MPIGFTTGRLDKFSLQDKLGCFAKLGCSAIELSAIDVNRLPKIIDGKETLREMGFVDYKHHSFHLPAKDFEYNDGELTNKTLEEVVALHEEFKFDCAVLHPDRVKNWDVLRKYNLPYAVENMDHRKGVGRTVEDMKKIFDKFDAGMVLDVNHCYANDRSSQLADDFYAEFGDRIIEIHLSGCGSPRYLHDPLFETLQPEIIESIPDKTIPIIIESPQKTVADIEEEWKYIKKYLDVENI